VFFFRVFSFFFFFFFFCFFLFFFDFSYENCSNSRESPVHPTIDASGLPSLDNASPPMTERVGRSESTRVLPSLNAPREREAANTCVKSALPPY